VQQIELSYAIAPRRAGAGRPWIRNPLMALLQALREHGSISAAARALGFSYRHVWGELKRWEAELGHALVVWEKGQPARLSEFGDKLLWAERQAQARLAPQIEALHADLERAFALAFDDRTHVLNLHASHDDALALLRVHAAGSSARLHLDIRFTGSVDAIRALNQGRCTMAGTYAVPLLAARTCRLCRSSRFDRTDVYMEARVDHRYRYYRARPSALGPLRASLERMWDDALWRLKLAVELEQTRRGPRPRKGKRR